MEFKSGSMKTQYYNAPALLKLIVEDFERISKQFGIAPTITRITDTVIGESGVHPAGRAIDIRDEYIGKRLYTGEQKDALINFINALYIRTDGKKVIIHHAFDGGPYHFHVQIPHDQLSILLARG